MFVCPGIIFACFVVQYVNLLHGFYIMVTWTWRLFGWIYWDRLVMEARKTEEHTNITQLRLAFIEMWQNKYGLKISCHCLPEYWMECIINSGIIIADENKRIEWKHIVPSQDTMLVVIMVISIPTPSLASNIDGLQVKNYDLCNSICYVISMCIYTHTCKLFHPQLLHHCQATTASVAQLYCWTGVHFKVV